ncbi:TetR/AcrR family transcriptional regulator [Kerstersia gyiorum]|jgi:AcrR family transcriptional regulator|uniref:TetR family transcriptional regulator n=1 Tax=Kerstersia gyiorum TaxID=206506 RepID=A0A171KP22_9BURK|nr:TetR/AcrR family transcriptional regulator [Kerstersia gyiorum]MCO7637915.1 TetR family transcriptional regulator [Pseudomonas sp. S 311-6]KKO70639.1 TetR family transcriptional regulator [Kerstersia gyiorum]MCH4270965.1 TetR family transcriptional regulator [Kerstersia gyiorum]MCI1230310.1 TetR family transcriptional regulator [Kerstersia gyiorum]MCP1634000.1 AcrR family transcriptional regulator [Kerstersia gyiorum]
MTQPSDATPRPEPKGKNKTGRTNDPKRTMQDIIEVATQEFARKGLTGARIDEIAALTRTSKRMIYYYFENKEGLYVAVLEAVYRRLRSIENELHLDDLDPQAAMRRLVEFTFDYHYSNPDFVRLVMTENIHNGVYLARSRIIQELNIPAINSVSAVYERGVAQGLFRPGLLPIDLHHSISALCFFNASNQSTFSLVFKRDFSDPAIQAARREEAVDMMIRYVRRHPDMD